MFFFYFNDQSIEVKISTNPNECDLAIVSINAFGTMGTLNQLVIEKLGYDESILDRIALDKGFDLLNGQGKSILFIVTVGNKNTQNLLEENLTKAINYYRENLANKTIWIPLMGTGAGELTFLKSYDITYNILSNFIKRNPNLKTKFTIALPDNSKGQKILNDIIFNNNKELKTNIDNLLSTKNQFHLVGSSWDNQDQSDYFYEKGIWQNKHGSDRFEDRVNKINVGDVLFNKSTFAKSDGSSYLRIKGVGIATENLQDSTTIKCNWIYKNLKIDIQNLSHYRDTISQPSYNGLITILQNLGIEITGRIYEAVIIILNTTKDVDNDENIIPVAGSGNNGNNGNVGNNNVDNKENDNNDKSSNKSNQPNKKIPGVVTDADDGVDFLNIKEDVNAFARVIAAKSFEPPLAIALFGNWGSGKSFFMRKLRTQIQLLSDINPENQFCQGIAHVHFNAWSYMDANLWASIVTRIFESLDDYIKNTTSTQKEIEIIENQLFSKLNLSKEQLDDLEKKKKALDKSIQKLESKKNKLKSRLDRKVNYIKTKTLSEILEEFNDDYGVVEKIENAIEENQSFVDTKEKFKKLVPEKYWNNPSEFYKQLKSITTFIKLFFKRKDFCNNLFWIVGIVFLLFAVPVALNEILFIINKTQIDFLKINWTSLSLLSVTFFRGIDTLFKLKKEIAPFWKIKEEYEEQKANAIFKFEQEEKALKIEIENYNQEIIQIENQIVNNKEIKASLEYKLKYALSTEALYSFIEKRAASDDYKKHLGIVSLIRKDFEILSGLLTRHKTELVTQEESDEFKKLFKNKGDKNAIKPLERIILYIDDLDRCPEERVVEVLEAVNLLMAFPLFVVVVGVDPRWVKKALLKKYKNQFTNIENEDTISPSNYLEKIFQVPFHLKNAEDASIKFMLEQLASSNQSLSRDLLLKTDTNILEDIKTDLSDNEEENLEVEKTTDEKTTDENEENLENETTNVSLESKPIVKTEQIEALIISETEIENIKKMSVIIGNNPRAVKRFINVYRIIKTHEDFNFTTNIEVNELILLMFLLALPMGKYKSLNPQFESFLNKEVSIFETLENFCSTFYESDSDEIKKLKVKLKVELVTNLDMLLKVDTEKMKSYYDLVKRFTFKNI